MFTLEPAHAQVAPCPSRSSRLEAPLQLNRNTSPVINQSICQSIHVQPKPDRNKQRFALHFDDGIKHRPSDTPSKLLPGRITLFTMSHVAGDVGDEAPTIPKRSSIEKLPLLVDSDLYDDLDDDDAQPTAFDKLPEEIIQQ